MGHLMFAGVFVFMVLLIVGKPYFSYIYASKKKALEDDHAEMPEEPEKQEESFYVHKGITLIGGFLVLLTPFLLVYFFGLLKNEPQSADGLWMLIDLLISAFFVFVLFFLTCLRSYVHIHEEGFEYMRSI